MPSLQLDDIQLSYGTHILLDDASLSLGEGDKVGLIGRNGAGKTSLLRIIAGTNAADSGKRWLRPGLKIAWLDQNLPKAERLTVFDFVVEGLPDLREQLRHYHALTQSINTDLRLLEQVQHELEASDGWMLQQRVDRVLSQLELPADEPMERLSGGWRRRAALARALVTEPDILLLDEPTNHLDIPSIQWLERQLQSFSGAIVFITHDRRFLQLVANRIMELDRGRLLTWQGDYSGFLHFKSQEMAAEARAQAEFDRKLAQEERWIRQGIKARRTRNEGRVRALEVMRRERSNRREIQGNAKIQLEDASSSGKLVAELTGVCHAYGEQMLLHEFSGLIMRGDRIGFVGANGVGKTTLLKIILGTLNPDEGRIKLGSKLEIAYFDQLRDTLEMDKNLVENICGGRDFIEINGKDRHAISYLGDFLFSPERARAPVKALSGGEQNRAILAKLFSRPANLLVLDEPTNDLDVETLELLEELLLKFEGTVLLVSHDREFMDNVVTSILVFEGNGRVTEHVGGYSDWAKKGGTLAAHSKLPAKPGKPLTQKSPGKSRKQNSSNGAKKLTYKERRELESLPALIETLEGEQDALEEAMGKTNFYERPHLEVNKDLEHLADIQDRLETAYERWALLEENAS